MFGTDGSALIDELDAANADVARAYRRLFHAIAAVGDVGSWHDDGARDLAHWLSMRYGISTWKADRWIASARRLPELPAIAGAFATGDLSLDKTVELTRFATPQDERRLLTWARDVSVTSVRRRADRAARVDAEEVVADERARRLEWWWLDEGRRLGMSGELPAAQGAVVVRALERAAERLPAMPDEGQAWTLEARRADALVAICSNVIATDADPDRATVVLHARVDETGMLEEAEIEGATPVPRSVAERLVCDARIEVAFEDRDGDVVAVGRARREPTATMIRHLRYRDRGCRFPGCGTAAFTQAHHIRWWSRGGRTDLDNLVLICSFHHRLVHEYGWAIARSAAGEMRWITPYGERYRAGPRTAALV